MSLPRRLRLLKWGVVKGAWIVEDEYDAEYRYFGRPVPAVQSLDESGSVIYIGTFTKMLFNSVRLGFAVLPERLVEAFSAARSLSDRHPPTLQQAILAEFILEGHFSHHVRRMRQIYARAPVDFGGSGGPPVGRPRRCRPYRLRHADYRLGTERRE